MEGPDPWGCLMPNELGLYDMSGNVDEWCEFRYDPDSEERVVRGGSWGDADINCRVSARVRVEPGFVRVNSVWVFALRGTSHPLVLFPFYPFLCAKRKKFLFRF